MTARVRVAVALAALVVLGTPGVSAAHTGLVGSAPTEGAIADRAVTSITLTFESALAPDLADVAVLGEDRADRVVGNPAVQGSVLTVAVRPLDVAGSYAVSYRVVAIDGHPVSGSYRFDVSEVGARDARLVADQLLGSPGALPPLQANPRSASWGDLAPELGLVLLALLILGASTVRRAQVRRDELAPSDRAEQPLVGRRHG